MTPTWKTICVMAAAAGIWRRSTMPGTAAMRAVLEKPVRPAASALMTYSATSDGWSTAALTAMAPLVTIMATAVHAMIRRLSTVSPMGPAERAPTRKGKS